MSFDTKSENGFALVAADGMPVNWSEGYSFIFHKVDINTSTFLPEVLYVHFSGAGSIEGNEFEKPDNLNTSVRFGGAVVSPGDYALTARVDSGAYGTVKKINLNCYSLGAVVFHINSGNVNIIPVGSISKSSTKTETPLTSQVTAVLSGYPKILAPISVSEIIGKITFETKNVSPRSQTCGMSDKFSFYSIDKNSTKSN